MKPDTFGLIDETHFQLRHPRTPDDTAPTVAEAMVQALQMMEDGAEKVSICTIHKGREVETIITVTAYIEPHQINEMTA